MSDNKEAKVVVAPSHKITRIKERLDRNGRVITREVQAPKR